MTGHFLLSVLIFLILGGMYFVKGINIIPEWIRRPVLLFGRYDRTAGPGFVWIDPIFHKVLDDVPIQDVVNKIRVENVPTSDNVRLQVELAATTRISPDKVKDLIVNVKNPSDALLQRALTSVTETVGQDSLDYIVSKKIEFSESVKISLQKKVLSWGIEVKAVEISELKIADENIERATAMKARAAKEAEAELTRAEMQVTIAEHLKKAAGTYDEQAWTLKGLETLVELCRSAQNNTILIPTDLLQGIAKVIPEYKMNQGK